MRNLGGRSSVQAQSRRLSRNLKNLFLCRLTERYLFKSRLMWRSNRQCLKWQKIDNNNHSNERLHKNLIVRGSLESKWRRQRQETDNMKGSSVLISPKSSLNLKKKHSQKQRKQLLAQSSHMQSLVSNRLVRGKNRTKNSPYKTESKVRNWILEDPSSKRRHSKKTSKDGHPSHGNLKPSKHLPFNQSERLKARRDKAGDLSPLISQLKAKQHSLLASKSGSKQTGGQLRGYKSLNPQLAIQGTIEDRR